MSTHSVHGHLGVAAQEYDKAIRQFVPHYEEMIATAIGLLGRLAPARARILDLGGGTGALSAAVLAGLPEAKAILLDIDAKMLTQARERLRAASARVTFVEASFHDPLPECDAVVASLSLHHVPTMDLKTGLYANIRERLPRGGVFLNLDATVSADPKLKQLAYDDWVASMGRQGIAGPEARQHLAAWAEEDTYMPLERELAALREAGFADPECFWKRGPIAIYGALKE